MQDHLTSPLAVPAVRDRFHQGHRDGTAKEGSLRSGHADIAGGRMSQVHGQEQEYERMRGEYLSLVASLEYNLTFLLAEYLNVQRYHEEFHYWFTQVPHSVRRKGKPV